MVRGATIIRRILLVEDDPGVREALRALLVRVGFQVVAASNGAEAWDLLGSGPRFAAILVDLCTPRMTGNDSGGAGPTDPAPLRGAHHRHER